MLLHINKAISSWTGSGKTGQWRVY